MRNRIMSSYATKGTSSYHRQSRGSVILTKKASHSGHFKRSYYGTHSYYEAMPDPQRFIRSMTNTEYIKYQYLDLNAGAKYEYYYKVPFYD
jgi:hypothetical protein